MPDWDDVRRLALALRETSERISRENLKWRVRDKLFVWERPLRKGDLVALSTILRQGRSLERESDMGAKKSRLAQASTAFFTIPHFEGYLAVLVLLDELEMPELEQLIFEAWLARAPARLVKEFLDNR